MVWAEAFPFEGAVLDRYGHRILEGLSDHIHKASTTAVLGAGRSGNASHSNTLPISPTLGHDWSLR